MCAKSRKSAELKKPIDRRTLADAREVAARYQVILAEEDTEWTGRGLELPNVFGAGKTPEACIRDTREAFTLAVAYLLEQGRQPPAAAREGNRSMQVNVRLTPEEKALLESAARRKGYQGMSDFMRAAAIESAT